MRLNAVSIANTPPVRQFAVDDLSDVVVLAGPNGVGKTRLLERLLRHLRQGEADGDVRGTIEATCKEEREAWGKDTLDLATGGDMASLLETLKSTRKRRNWQSSLVNIESNRAIEKIDPLRFSWDLEDPEEEEIKWDVPLGYMRDRFQDTVHAMFRMIETRKQLIANRAIELQRQGHDTMRLRFSDPMEPFKQVFSRLLAPKVLVDPSAKQQRLEYSLSDEVFEFATLSSGEREVVNIAFDFLLRNPKHCVVFFDEPELHLHPELSYRLIQTLSEIGEDNQFLLSTHSPDVITASLDRTVIFVAPPTEAKDNATSPSPNQAIMVTESDRTHQALRLLGQSIGIVALGKRIVLIEGQQSSTDKQTYGSIIKNRWPDLVLVPSGGKHVIQSFETVHESVLSQSLWGVDFFMLCDRDSVPVGVGDGSTASEGRLRVLKRYHLENYFLDEAVWAEAFSVMEEADSPLRDPVQIRERFREAASELVSYATALATASHFRAQVGSLDVMLKDCHGKELADVLDLIAQRVEVERTRITSSIEPDVVKQWAQDYFTGLTKSLETDDDGWKASIPGKPLLKKFASISQVNYSRAKRLYVNQALTSERAPFAEITGIFESFAEG